MKVGDRVYAVHDGYGGTELSEALVEKVTAKLIVLRAPAGEGTYTSRPGLAFDCLSNHPKEALGRKFFATKREAVTAFIDRRRRAAAAHLELLNRAEEWASTVEVEP